jgi:hypothetical protein
MHLAGGFRKPSLILLGEWYDSAELHQKQWGYTESMIKGKEGSSNKKIISVNEAYQSFKKLMFNAMSV